MREELQDDDSDDDKPILQLTREISERRELNDAIILASERSQDDNDTAIRESMNYLVGDEGNPTKDGSNGNEIQEIQTENGDNESHDERDDDAQGNGSDKV